MGIWSGAEAQCILLVRLSVEWGMWKEHLLPVLPLMWSSRWSVCSPAWWCFLPGASRLAAVAQLSAQPRGIELLWSSFVAPFSPKHCFGGSENSRIYSGLANVTDELQYHFTGLASRPKLSLWWRWICFLWTLAYKLRVQLSHKTLECHCAAALCTRCAVPGHCQWKWRWTVTVLDLTLQKPLKLSPQKLLRDTTWS